LHCNPSGHRGQIELHGEQQDQQQTPPKDGHGISRKRYSHHPVVQKRVSLYRSQNSRWNADEQGKHDGAKCQLDGRWKKRHEFTENGRLSDDGFTQISVQYLADVNAVLNHHRFV
jgi:hypothetical protein